jgi:serine/threonine protein kinase
MGIDELTNNARVRHTTFMQYVLNQCGIKNQNGKPFKLVTRVGSSRSADGIVFDIGDGKVAKFMFVGKGAIYNSDVIKKEYDIAKRMSDVGAGPKVYGMVQFKLPKTLLNLKNNLGSQIKNWPTNANLVRKIANNYKAQGFKKGTNFAKNNIKDPNGKRARGLNLFQQWWVGFNNSYTHVTEGGIIFMENLYKGPDVKQTLPLYEYVTQLKKPYPVKELADAYKKMHSIKVAHHDLHARNILVQIKKNGSIRVVIIDFGRAKYPAKKLNMNNNWHGIQGFAMYAKVTHKNFENAFGKMPTGSSSSLSGVAPGSSSSLSGVAPVHFSKSSKVYPLAAPLVPFAMTYGLTKAASGGYRIKGKRGPIKPTKLTLLQLRFYAVNRGADPMAVQKAKTKKDLMNLIYAAKKGTTVPPKKTPPAAGVASSYGFVFNKGSVRMRGKKGLIKPTKLTVAQLKAYAAKKGINLTGAKLKKNILQRLAK